jgi:anti-sigma factor RsiW
MEGSDMSLVIDFRDSLHRHVERELPWYVTGRLDDELRRRRIEQHLAACGACREQEARARSLQAQMARPLPFAAGVPDFEKLARRIEAAGEATRVPTAPRRRTNALLWSLGLSEVALLLLVLVPSLRIGPLPTAEYRTLGAATSNAASGPRALMMFRPETTLADARRLLQANGASILDGPNPAGAYLVALPAAAPDRAIAALRRAPAVLLAERVDREAAR